MDEDTDQHSHPLFRMSPGMKMLGAEEEKESKHKKEREIPKKCYPTFPGNNTDNISKRGDKHEPPTVIPHGNEVEGRRTTAEDWPKDQTPGRKKVNVEGNGPGKNQGLCRYHTEPVEACEQPRSGSPQVALQVRARESDSRASTKMTAQFYTKRRSGSTKAPSSTDTKQTVPWPRGSTPVTTASGARRRQWSSITPSC